AGADGLIDGISQAVLDPGDQVVLGWPSFPSYVIYARKLGAEPVQVPLREHRYDLAALLDAVTDRTKLVYVCHPNNPTGTINTRAELDSYFDRVPPHVLTVLDQAYFEYIDDPDYVDGIDAGHKVAGPAVGNFLFVELGEDAQPWFEALLREGVIVRPLAGFGATRAVRVTVGTPDEHAFFARALAQMRTTAAAS